MKKINYYLATSTVAFALMAASPLLASAHTGADNSGSGKAGIEAHGGLNIMASLFHKGDDGDKDKDKDHATSTPKDIGVVAGIVTSVNGNVLTIKPFGKGATTTVTTNASTTLMSNGQATSTNALVVGAKVLAAGTATVATNISASFIDVFVHGFGFFKHLLSR